MAHFKVTALEMARFPIHRHRCARGAWITVVLLLSALFAGETASSGGSRDFGARKHGVQTSAAGVVAAFRARVEAVLSKSDAARAYWGIFIVDADTGETLYQL